MDNNFTIILDNSPVPSYTVMNSPSTTEVVLDNHHSKPTSKGTSKKPVTLKEIFQKQQQQQQQQLEVEVEKSVVPQNHPGETDTNSTTCTPRMNSISIESPPSANPPRTSTVVASCSTSAPNAHAVDNQLENQARQTGDEENLCVVCDDAKKQIILLPCKHMCLCKTCSAQCLFITIKECPLCRTEIKDSMEVFW